MTNTIFSILHISDLHRNEDGRVENTQLFSSLILDTERYVNPILENLPKPSIIIVSGDIIYGSSEIDIKKAEIELLKQYQEAEDFLNMLTNEFLNGDKTRIIIIPGNHDINWAISKASMELKDITGEKSEIRKKLTKDLVNPKSAMRWSWDDFSFYKIVDEDLYNSRLKYFAAFYAKFYNEKRIYSLDPEKQYDIFDIPVFNVTIFGYNSCFRNDHLNRSGLINSKCLSDSAIQLREYKTKGRLLLATWHHNISGLPNDSTYLDPRQIKLLISYGFKIGFHGHQHLSDILENYIQFDISRKLIAVSAGTLCSARSHLPTGYKRQYNLLKINFDSKSCHLYSREMFGNMDDTPIWDKGRINESLESNMELEIDFPTKVLYQITDQELDILQKASREKDFETFRKTIKTISIEEPFIRELIIQFDQETEGRYRDEICSVLINPDSFIEYITFIEYYIDLKEKGKAGELFEKAIIKFKNDKGIISELNKYKHRIYGY